MNQTVNEIVSVFEGFRMAPMPNDEYQQKGKGILIDKLSTFVGAGKTIDFVMLGFPFKSTNTRDKVLGQLPDGAEKATLENFAAFNEAIKAVYPAGVNIHMASDGFIFNELLGVDDKVVYDYQEVSEDMGKSAPMVWHNLHDFYSGSSTSEKLGKLTSHFGITAEKLQEEIMFNPDVNYLYRGMIHFMEEELAMKTFPSRNQHSKAAKALTREMMLRNEAWSNFVRKEFSSMIRLSMHPSVNSGAKYSFKLIRGEGARHSAWHSCLVVDANGSLRTMHKKDAEAIGAELVYENNRPFYYVNTKG